MTAVTVPNTQIETRWIDLTNQHRFDELSEVWAENTVLHQGSDVPDVHGFEALTSPPALFCAGIPDLHIHVEQVLGARDTVILRTTTTATHTGDLLGVPATGRTVRYVGVGTYRVIDGNIGEERLNDDLFGLTQTINAAAAPGMDRS